MSEVKVNKISPRTNCGTVTLGDSGDTFTIPSGATITNNGTQTGFGRTGTVDWITTPKVTGDSPITGVTGKGYFLNTTAGTITVNLPAGAAGSIVSMADYARTWATNNVTVSPNGSDKIGSTNNDALLSTNGQSVTFVYVDSTQGWLNVQDSTSNVVGTSWIVATGGDAVVTCGNYKTHIFTGPGTFCVSAAASLAACNSVDYLVEAGGGGGSCMYYGGGGGGGGFRLSNDLCMPAPTTSPLAASCGVTVTASPYAIAVGGGGAKGTPGNPTCGTAGVNSSFSTITSAGGGYGGAGPGNPTPAPGGDGGSGGGGGGGTSCAAGLGGAGNTPPVNPAQGMQGGVGFFTPDGGPSGGYSAAGGGGASAVGGNGATADGGDGGAGSYVSDTMIGPTAPSYGTPGPVGSTRYFAGGGGGGFYADPQPPTPSSGGVGGGGAGAPSAVAGVINTGGAGGGGSHSAEPPGVGTAGGSGIVIIRYKFQ
jgi:hypothetical protein